MTDVEAQVPSDQADAKVREFQSKRKSKPAGGDAVSEDLLRAEELVKSYGGRRVVDGVSFHVAPGEVVGLLGPNGAGKTTSFNMTVGLVVPEGGRVTAGRARPDPAPHAPPGPARARLPPAGGLGLPQADGPPELHRHPGGAGGGPAGSQRAGRRAHRRVPAGEGGRIAGRAALRRRAAPGRGGPQPALQPALHPLRRAVRRRGPHRRGRAAAAHRRPAGPGHRRAGHRPQRPRGAGHLRPRLHPGGRDDPGGGHPRRDRRQPARPRRLPGRQVPAGRAAAMEQR